MNEETRVGSAVSVTDACRSRDEAVLEAFSTDPTIAVWAVSSDLRVTYSNQAAARLVDRTPEQVVGMNLRELLPPEVAEHKQTIADRAMRGERVTDRMVWRGHCLWSEHVAVHGEESGHGEMVVVTRPDRGECDAREEVALEEAGFVSLGELDVLTPREIEVLALLGKGMRTDDIAKHLTRSPKTIQRFQEGIRSKLGITDRCLLSQLARERGLEPRHANLPRVDQGVGCG